ncbi:MAG: PepSY domain-containing protein, partial [Planctomycetota bacterium]
MQAHRLLSSTVIVAGSVLALACSTGNAHKSKTSPARTTHVVAAQVSGSIGLRHAIERALSACAGSAVEAEFETEVNNGTRSAFYEVLIVSSDNRLMEVTLDATNGQIVRTEVETDAGAAKELALFREILKHTTLRLTDLVAKAEARGGVAIGAELEMEGKAVECEVTLLKDQAVMEVSVDGKTGSIMESEDDDDDDDDDDD